jgi:hypothetical protein
VGCHLRVHVVKQIVFDGALVVILGTVVAFLYRDGKSA